MRRKVRALKRELQRKEKALAETAALLTLSKLAAARDWVHAFADGYNTVHRHCGIQYVTPQQRHSGEDVAILRQRHALYQAAQRQHPTRWSPEPAEGSGDTRNWGHIREVWLNPENDRALMTKVA